MLIKLVLKNISQNKLLAFITIFVILIAISFSIFLNFTYKNINLFLLNDSIWTWKQNKFILSPKWWSFLASSLGFEYDLEKTYNIIKKDKNIKNSFWIYKFEVPVTADLSWMSINFNTDMLMFASDKWFENSQDMLGLWISPSVLNLYNTQVSSKRMPKIDQKILKTLWVRLEFGKSSFTQFEKTKIEHWTINNLDPDLPLLGITMSYDQAKKIIEEINWWSLKLIQIIGEFENIEYLNDFKKIHSSTHIESAQEKEIMIENKIKTIKDVINLLKYMIYFMMWSFLVSLIFNLYNNNSRTLKVFHYHGAWFFQKFMLLFWEICFYFICAVAASFVVIRGFNAFWLEILNSKVLENGIVNFRLQAINYADLSIVSLISFTFLSFVCLLFFALKNSQENLKNK